MRVGILTDYPSATTQAGPAVHTHLLAAGLRRRGHHVVLMGPDTSSVVPIDEPHTQLYHGMSYPTHPRVKIPMPGPLKTLLSPPELDVIHSQCNHHAVEYALWLREMWQIPVLHTHTVHFPSHSHFLISDSLYGQDWLRQFLVDRGEDFERTFAKVYNQGDRLIVQSRHFVDYWRSRGVTVPIEVVGRPVSPTVFSVQPGADPFPTEFAVGSRLLCVCRHDREKRLEHLLDMFTSRIAPADPKVTLTLVGGGHDHDNLRQRAASSPYADRIHMPGEVAHDTLVDWYAHADVFTYTSLSETFGNVVNEALWSGVPVVALDDRMGVAHQVVDRVNGFLIQPNRHDTDDLFAMFTDGPAAGGQLSRRTSHPDVIYRRFEQIYAEAALDCRRQIKRPLRYRSRLTQMRSFARHMAGWAGWNGLLLGIAHAATRLGAARLAPEQSAEVEVTASQFQAASAENRPAA